MRSSRAAWDSDPARPMASSSAILPGPTLALSVKSMRKRTTGVDMALTMPYKSGSFIRAGGFGRAWADGSTRPGGAIAAAGAAQGRGAVRSGGERGIDPGRQARERAVGRHSRAGAIAVRRAAALAQARGTRGP